MQGFRDAVKLARNVLSDSGIEVSVSLDLIESLRGSKVVPITER